jgi:hypothetical protein
MFEREKRYITCGIDQRLPQDLQRLIWTSVDARILFSNEKIDYLQVFTFKKIDEEILSLHHEQEEPPLLNVHYTNYRPEYDDILNEKIFVIDDGDHSTMLFAYEY